MSGPDANKPLSKTFKRRLAAAWAATGVLYAGSGTALYLAVENTRQENAAIDAALQERDLTEITRSEFSNSSRCPAPTVTLTQIVAEDRDGRVVRADVCVAGSNPAHFTRTN